MSGKRERGKYPIPKAEFVRLWNAAGSLADAVAKVNLYLKAAGHADAMRPQDVSARAAKYRAADPAVKKFGRGRERIDVAALNTKIDQIRADLAAQVAAPPDPPASHEEIRAYAQDLIRELHRRKGAGPTP
jgi:hypothetical protein